MRDITAIIEKTVHLDPQTAEQLTKLAASGNLTEDEIVQKALEVFFSLSADGLIDRDAWAQSSEKAFNRVWDNAQDAAYDNWKEAIARRLKSGYANEVCLRGLSLP